MPVKPSSKMTYAIRALVDLALHQAVGPVTVATIAKRQKIPVRYLEQLFNRLKKQELVIAERGPRGGYRLAKPADQISVGRVFESLETEPAAKTQKTGRQTDPTTTLWRQLEMAVQTTLEATTLGSLVEQAREQEPSEVKHSYTFHI